MPPFLKVAAMSQKDGAIDVLRNIKNNGFSIPCHFHLGSMLAIIKWPVCKEKKENNLINLQECQNFLSFSTFLDFLNDFIPNFR